MDVLMPLAASVVSREGGLSPEDSIAMTAAAMLIEGPLALAPAIVAVETQRGSGFGSSSVGAAPPVSRRVGPELVPVPNVVKKSEAEATKALTDGQLRSRVEYNEASDALVGLVVRQTPAPSGDNESVPAGSVVVLNVGQAKAKPAEDADQVTEAEFEAGLTRVEGAVGQKFDAVDQRFNGIDQQFATADQRLNGIDQQLRDTNAKLDRLIAMSGSGGGTAAKSPTKS